MTDSARRFAVARIRKPHGLKGEVAIFPLTDDPDTVFARGNELWVVDLAGEVRHGPLTIDRGRGYHREWIVKLAGIEHRDAVESWRSMFFAVPADRLAPPKGDEVYLHELEGFAVRLTDGSPIGLVTSMYELPSGLMIEVQGPKREFLLPYKKEFVTEVDRAARRLTVVLPEGLLDG